MFPGVAPCTAARGGSATLGPLLPPAMRAGSQNHPLDLRRKKFGCSCIPSGRRCTLHPEQVVVQPCPSPGEGPPLADLCSQFSALRQQKQVYSKESFQERGFKIHPLSSETKQCQGSEKPHHLSCSEWGMLSPCSPESHQKTPIGATRPEPLSCTVKLRHLAGLQKML